MEAHPRSDTSPGGAHTVGDLMQRDVVSVRPDTTLREVIRVLGRQRISGCPVVDDDGRAVGTVSVSDLLWLSDQLVPAVPGSSEWRERSREILDGRTAAEIMTPDVFGIERDRSLAELSQFFARTGLHRALVVEEGALAGIVSISDLLNFVASGSPGG